MFFQCSLTFKRKLEAPIYISDSVNPSFKYFKHAKTCFELLEEVRLWNGGASAAEELHIRRRFPPQFSTVQGG